MLHQEPEPVRLNINQDKIKWLFVCVHTALCGWTRGLVWAGGHPGQSDCGILISDQWEDGSGRPNNIVLNYQKNIKKDKISPLFACSLSSGFFVTWRSTWSLLTLRMNAWRLTRVFFFRVLWSLQKGADRGWLHRVWQGLPQRMLQVSRMQEETWWKILLQRWEGLLRQLPQVKPGDVHRMQAEDRGGLRGEQ